MSRDRAVALLPGQQEQNSASKKQTKRRGSLGAYSLEGQLDSLPVKAPEIVPGKGYLGMGTWSWDCTRGHCLDGRAFQVGPLGAVGWEWCPCSWPGAHEVSGVAVTLFDCKASVNLGELEACMVLTQS